MLHHDRAFIESIQGDRQLASARRRAATDPGALEHLVRAAAAGDERAWSSLLAQFSARVRAVARVYGLNSHDADDVVQSTWLKLLSHIGRVREPAAIGGWLNTTARRESLRVLSSTARERPTDEQLRAGEQSEREADHDLLRAERKAVVGVALEALAERQRAMLGMLLADTEPSYAEIATALDMPIGSIGPTRRRCLERLRKDRRLATVVDP